MKKIAISPANVQQAIAIIDRAPASIEEVSLNYLQQIGTINSQVTQASNVAAGAGVDPSFTAAVQQSMINISNMPSVINNAKTQINGALDQTANAIEQLSTALQSMQSVQQSAQQVAPNPQNAANAEAGQMGVSASRKVFNWKMAQMPNQELSQGLGNDISDSFSGDSAEGFGPFENTSDLLEKLEGMDRAEAENKLLSYISDPQGQEIARKTMEIVFEHELGPQEQLEAMSQVWDYLPDAIKTKTEQLTSIEGDYVHNQGQQTMANLENIKKLVHASNEEIRKMAQKEKPKSFNFKKQAQHKTNENVILWGPESRNNVDPFTGQPASDWHVFERNKGWGFRIGDRWDIDFEAFWRGNIMDKYSRPYRDEDGNWVGGYIEKRFEVDRWQPEENTYMLKPGEKRKPRPAELGNMEARLEAYRGNEDKVFNWKNANSNKVNKTASSMEEQITRGAKKEYDKIKSENPEMSDSNAIKLAAQKFFDKLNVDAQNFLLGPGGGGVEFIESLLDDAIETSAYKSILSSSKKKKIKSYNHSKDKRTVTAISAEFNRDFEDKYWQQTASGMPLDSDEVEMIQRMADKLGRKPQSNFFSLIRFVGRQLGVEKEQAREYAVPLYKLLRGPTKDDKPTDPNLIDRFSSTKTALKPMPVNKGPRKPPGYHQLHDKDINVQPYCSCGICGSGVNCNGGSCPNCSADSTNFVKGDPKTKRDELLPKKPQAPQVRNMPLQAVAAIIDNKEKDDKKPFDKKLQEYSYNTDETKNFEESVEKSFSDPYDDENSDKNHTESVEQTWKELSGE